MNVPLVHPDAPVGKLKVPVALVLKYAIVPVPIMVPLDDPDTNPTDTFRLELAADVTCPVTVNVVPVAAIAGKQEPDGLFTPVTVPLNEFPFWLKLIVSVVVGIVDPAANAAFHVPVTTAV